MKNRKRQWTILISAAALLLISASPAHARHEAPKPEQAQQTEQEQWRSRSGQQDAGHEGKDWHAAREQHRAFRLQRLKEAAEYFGIATEGKSAKQLHEELRTARHADKAKWERYKAEFRAKRLAHLQKIAAKLGIAVEGKTMRELSRDIRAEIEGIGTKQGTQGRQS